LKVELLDLSQQSDSLPVDLDADVDSFVTPHALPFAVMIRPATAQRAVFVYRTPDMESLSDR